jgi:xanthine dehydrogenase accessory factor
VRERFGVAEEGAFAAGLTCGGTIDVFVEPVSSAVLDWLRRVQQADRNRRPIASAVIVDGSALGHRFVLDEGAMSGTTGSAAINRAVRVALTEAHSAGWRGIDSIEADGEVFTLFIDARIPPPRLLVFGAVEFAAALSHLGKLLGYHVTVCDARPIFATAARFPEADEVVADWPHRYLQSTAPELDERTVLCAMTHDPKFDIPLLECALGLPIAYVGALGSRQACASRIEELRARGITDEQLSRLHAPIGLDIGGSTPMETAVAIAAEILADRHQRPASPLMHGHGLIHPRTRPAGGSRSGYAAERVQAECR